LIIEQLNWWRRHFSPATGLSCKQISGWFANRGGEEK
jgi:hypothetical protein